RAYRRNGRLEEALACLDAALAQPDPESPAWGQGAWFDRGQAWLDQAALFASLGQRDRAASAFQEAVRCGGRAAVWGWIGIAKHREHRERDAIGALDAAEAAYSLMVQRRSLGRFDRDAERDLTRRLRRLRDRVARRKALADLRASRHGVQARL